MIGHNRWEACTTLGYCAMTISAPRLSLSLKRSLIVVHRWLGVALSVVFLIWFVSGIVMMYWNFPSISAKDRLRRAPTLDPTRITVSPEQAFAALKNDQSTAHVRLSSFDGRPVYRFGGGGTRDGQRRQQDDQACHALHQVAEGTFPESAQSAEQVDPLGARR